jgi:hypothetical protein
MKWALVLLLIWLFRSTYEEAPIIRENLFSQNILDALSSQISVLDHFGNIVQVNAA